MERPERPGWSSRSGQPGRPGRRGAGPPGAGGASLRDPAAQPERTRLAWQRTALAFAVAVALAARRAVEGGAAPAAWGPAAAGALAWLAFLSAARRRVRALGAARPRPLEAPAAVAAAACTLALPIVGVVVLLW